jgi:hypothetical protein
MSTSAELRTETLLSSWARPFHDAIPALHLLGALMNLTADHPESLVRVATFAQGLAELGWTIGRNVRIEYRWGAGDVDRYPKLAAELVAFEPDVILTVGGNTAKALQQATRSVPIVFVTVIDPVGRGLVASLARPGGNATGFMSFEYAVSGKWLELLKQIAPRARDASGSPSGPHHSHRGRYAWRNPGGGTIVRRGTVSGRCARRRRD